MELRADDGEDGEAPSVLEGHAAVFGKRSELLGGMFFEIIERGAFDGVLDDDVRAFFNHDPNMVIGRTGRNLEIGIDDDGLSYRINLLSDDVSQRVAQLVRDGMVTQSSFGFTVAEDEWRELKDGTIERRIHKVERLYDVSPVSIPAYPDTDVAVRRMEEIRRSQDGPKEADEQVEARICELADSLDNVVKRIDDLQRAVRMILNRRVG